MNSIAGYSSSDDDEASNPNPFKTAAKLFNTMQSNSAKRQLLTTEIDHPNKKPTAENQLDVDPLIENGKLFDRLPKPKFTNLGDRNPVLGESSDGKNSMIILPKPINSARSSLFFGPQLNIQAPTKIIESELKDDDEEEVSYFTFVEPDLLPKIGALKASETIYASYSETAYFTEITELPEELRENEPDLIDNSEQMLKIGHHKSDGEISFIDISQKEIVGDSYAQQKMRNITQNDGIVSDSAYIKLPTMINQGRGTGGRNIMTLAYEAKARQSQLDEQREHARTVKKMVRQKYGF